MPVTLKFTRHLCNTCNRHWVWGYEWQGQHVCDTCGQQTQLTDPPIPTAVTMWWVGRSPLDNFGDTYGNQHYVFHGIALRPAEWTVERFQQYIASAYGEWIFNTQGHRKFSSYVEAFKGIMFLTHEDVTVDYLGPHPEQ
jgi:hypothetical protein